MRKWFLLRVPYRIVWHEPPSNRVLSYRLNLGPFPLIHEIFAWAEDMVPISSMDFVIGDKKADAMHVPLVRLGHMDPLLIHLCTKKY